MSFGTITAQYTYEELIKKVRFRDFNLTSNCKVYPDGFSYSVKSKTGEKLAEINYGQRLIIYDNQNYVVCLNEKPEKQEYTYDELQTQKYVYIIRGAGFITKRGIIVINDYKGHKIHVTYWHHINGHIVQFDKVMLSGQKLVITDDQQIIIV